MCVKTVLIVISCRCSSASRSWSLPVSSVTRVDLPWSMCPAVPRITSEDPYALDGRLHGIEERLVLTLQDRSRVQAARVFFDARDDGGFAAPQRGRKPGRGTGQREKHRR